MTWNFFVLRKLTKKVSYWTNWRVIFGIQPCEVLAVTSVTFLWSYRASEAVKKRSKFHFNENDGRNRNISSKCHETSKFERLRWCSSKLVRLVVWIKHKRRRIKFPRNWIKLNIKFWHNSFEEFNCEKTFCCSRCQEE